MQLWPSRWYNRILLFEAESYMFYKDHTQQCAIVPILDEYIVYVPRTRNARRLGTQYLQYG